MSIITADDARRLFDTTSNTKKKNRNRAKGKSLQHQVQHRQHCQKWKGSDLKSSRPWDFAGMLFQERNGARLSFSTYYIPWKILFYWVEPDHFNEKIFCVKVKDHQSHPCIAQRQFLQILDWYLRWVISPTSSYWQSRYLQQSYSVERNGHFQDVVHFILKWLSEITIRLKP